MASSKRQGKVKEWIRRVFSSKSENHYQADIPRRRSRSQYHFGLHDPELTNIEGNNNTVAHVHGNHGNALPVMTLLSHHIIQGAAHDSSARTPPPRCHPETRVKLMARITDWFNDQGQHQEELVLWITGPAGSGKSAIVQTFAEYLVKMKYLGASVFFSRPNKRNNPHGVFITIAYQLATRIEEYHDFIAERLLRDPELLHGDMQAQFTAFIVDPFVGRGIGAGGRRWGILLDGLDELDGEDPQCGIIELISKFAREHRYAPLIWIIASRPESHISNTFEDDDVRCSCRSEHLPIDSTEACDDVDRFLRSSFASIQKKFRHSVPRDWPNSGDFLKLTAAASGLFIYAEVVMQFIRDPSYSDPVSRLKVLLAILDHSNAPTINENPFYNLDTLYREILSSIPSHLWPTAKRMLGFVNRQSQIFDWFCVSELGTLRGMAILFGLQPHVIYSSIIKCHSTLRVPDWKVAHKKQLTVLHASFTDFLKDPQRSGKFYLGSDEEIDDDIGECLLMLWNRCSGNGVEMGSVKATWRQYCSRLDDKPPSRVINKFHDQLFNDVVFFLSSLMQHTFKKRAGSFVYAELYDVHMIKLSYSLKGDDVAQIVDALTTTEVNDTNLLRRISFKDLTFGHLDMNTMKPTWAYYARTGTFSRDQWLLTSPRSSNELGPFIHDIEHLQIVSPEHEVTIFGGVPEGRAAVFRYPLAKNPGYRQYIYYIIPYPG